MFLVADNQAHSKSYYYQSHTPITPQPIRHIGNMLLNIQRFRNTHIQQFTQSMNQVDIHPFIIATDIVSFAKLFLQKTRLAPRLGLSKYN